MESLKDFFIALVCSGLSGKAVSGDIVLPADEETLKKLYKLSQAQSLTHLVAQGLWINGLLDRSTEVGKSFYKAQMLCAMRNEALDHALNTVSEAFCEIKVPFIPLKGSVLKRYYPEPWMRTSCDIDILIDPADEQKCTDVLCNKLGYTFKSKDSYDISFYSADGIHLELHFGLMENRFAASKYLSRVWEISGPVLDGSYRYEMSDDMFYFHQVAHLYKHFVSGGCGVRLFMDLYVLNHHPAFKKSGEYKRYLKEIKLTDFEKEIVHLSEVWFGCGEHTDLSRQVEQYVMGAGIFGNIKNEVALNRESAGGRVGYAAKRIFLPLKVLCEYYPELRSRKWLAPVYQVKRWINVVKDGHVKRAYNELSLNNSVSEEYADSLRDMMKKLKV